MSTFLPIPSGPTNREIIERAWQVIGTSDAMFGRTQEELATGVGVLGAMMTEWPFDQLGYIYEDAAGLRVEEESGIARKWREAVAYCLAERLAPMIGKALLPGAVAVRTALYSRLCAQTLPAPQSYAPGTIRGAGGKRRHGGPFFPPGEQLVITQTIVETEAEPLNIDSLPTAP